MKEKVGRILIHGARLGSFIWGRNFVPLFENDFQNVYTPGDGGLFTNIKDMSKWVNNFYNPKVGDLNDIVQFTEKGKLKNGKSLTYALGIGVDECYLGWQESLEKLAKLVEPEIPDA